MILSKQVELAAVLVLYFAVIFFFFNVAVIGTSRMITSIQEAVNLNGKI